MSVPCKPSSGLLPSARRLLVAALFPVLAGCAMDPNVTMPTADGHGVMTLDVGGAPVKFRPIEGWCPASRDQTRKIVKDVSDAARVLVAFGDCKQLQAAGEADKSITDYGILAAPTDMLNTDVGDDRAAFVDRVVENAAVFDLDAIIREAVDSTRQQTQSEIDAAKRAGFSLQIHDPVDLGLLAHDNAAYFGVAQRVVIGLVGSDAYTRDIGFVTLFCVTELRGRAILLAMQIEADSPPLSNRSPAVKAALKLARSQVERLIELNPDLGQAI